MKFFGPILGIERKLFFGERGEEERRIFLRGKMLVFWADFLGGKENFERKNGDFLKI